MGYIYKITNIVNSKNYIGQTRSSIQERWRQHLREADNDRVDYPLYMAMRKYGQDNFEINLVEEVPDYELNDRETYWINYYNSYIGNGEGYNCTYGGEGNSTINRDEVMKLWDDGHSIKQIADKLCHDRSAIRHVLQNYNGYTVEESNRRGDCLQNESRFIPIYQYDVNGDFIARYNSREDAERATGIKISNIWEALSGHSYTAGGYQWKYEKYDKIEDVSAKARNYKQKVIQKDKDGNVLQIYESASSASKKTGINSTSIRCACNGSRISAGGYLWEYKKEGDV
jgi:group I intron endonuclease